MHDLLTVFEQWRASNNDGIVEVTDLLEVVATGLLARKTISPIGANKCGQTHAARPPLGPDPLGYNSWHEHEFLYRTRTKAPASP